MQKYKVCPSCGERNSPTSIECMECETDIMGIKVVDKITENAFYVAKPTTELVRVCDCGEINQSSARKCSTCGEDISDIAPTTKSSTGRDEYLLKAIDNDFVYKIAKVLSLIGRE